MEATKAAAIENIENRPMPSSAWVGWRGVENVWVLLEAAKAADLLSKKKN